MHFSAIPETCKEIYYRDLCGCKRMMLAVAVLFVAGYTSVAHAAIGSSEHRGLLYPHMRNNGDTELSPGDDVSVKFSTNCRYKLYGSGAKKVYISSNGYVTLFKEATEWIPKNMCDAPINLKMVAPMWSDNLPQSWAESPHIWYREDTTATLLERATNDIRDTFKTDCCDEGEECPNDFEPECLLIVTWQRQMSYCVENDMPSKRDVELGLEKRFRRPEDPNYYQLVWATDGEDSYTIFNYLTINWWDCWEYSRAGFYDHNDYNPKCAELPYSGTKDVNLLEFNMNSNNEGRWIYRTDRNLIKKPDCSNLKESPVP